MAITDTGLGRVPGDIGKPSDPTYSTAGYIVRNPLGSGGGTDTSGDRLDFSTSNVGRVVRNPGGGQATPGGTQDASAGSSGYRNFGNFVGGVVRRSGR